ncbi:MAG: hypothetical protein ACE37B_22190 [Ilumatobacter sp.]|jgi:hypothetical protein|uniref:hypothetical protein n=1 Tax=Ilumatobacter sp. TaxID=1967498 RepID=UPI00391D7008
MGLRRFVSPEPGEDLESVATRVLPETSDPVNQLLSWNLHLAARRGRVLLPSDIVFTEPPPASRE